MDFDDFDDLIRSALERESQRIHEHESVLRSARRADARAAGERDLERRRRAHRLIVIGATVEMVWGPNVDLDYLAGALAAFDPARLSPHERDELTASGRDLAQARLAEIAVASRPLGRHDLRVSFPDQPPAGLRAALRKARFRFKPSLVSWVGFERDLPPGILDAVRRVHGSVTRVAEPVREKKKRGRKPRPRPGQSPPETAVSDASVPQPPDPESG